ncbi:MAG: TRAP transporter small permease subunit [Mesorhizobium sp.]
MTMLDQLERLGLRSTRALSAVGLTALIFLAVLTLADGLLRWLANAPIDGARDLGGLAIAIAITCCVPVGLMERSNITLRFLEGIAGRTISTVFDVLASITVAIVMVVMAWQFTLYAGKLARAHETTWVLQVPVAPYWYVVAAIFWIAVIVQAIVVAVDIGRLFGRQSIISEHQGGDSQ